MSTVPVSPAKAPRWAVSTSEAMAISASQCSRRRRGKGGGVWGIGADAGRPDANRDEPGETVGAECRNRGNDRGEGELDAVFDGETGEAGTLPFDPTVRVIKADPTVCLAEIDREQARLNGCAHEILTLLYKDNLQDACNQSK